MAVIICVVMASGLTYAFWRSRLSPPLHKLAPERRMLLLSHLACKPKSKRIYPKVDK